MISIEQTKKFEKVSIDSGLYKAVIVDTKEWQNALGVVKLIVECEIQEGKFAGKQIGAFYTRKITPNTSLGKLLINLGFENAIKEVGKTFDETQLFGTKVNIVVANVQNNKGETVSVVQSMFKA
jgi:hypothetical protein